MLPVVPKAGYAVVWAVVLLFLAGCGPGTEETERRIMERDPGFAELLERRDELRESMRDRDLRRQARDGITAMRSQLERELRDLRIARRSVRMRVFSLNNDVRKYEGIVEDKARRPTTSEAELQGWRDRLAELAESAERAEAERDRIEAMIALTEMKIKVMRP